LYYANQKISLSVKMVMQELERLREEIIRCEKCARLVEYRKRVAQLKVKRYANWDYWGKPLPGFGDFSAEILVVGLAPAAHGGNRTGRMFTGDASGDFLISSLFRCGLANQPQSISRDDGLVLRHVYISAALRCPPPANKPLKEELENCFTYLVKEYNLLPNVKVLVALGAIAFYTCVKLLQAPNERFEHGKILKAKKTLIASYHPSRRNTQTGLLKPEMLDAIFEKAKAIAGIDVVEV
jgi:uracil-DNA glycosylase family 4